jgi:hypothetical protein
VCSRLSAEEHDIPRYFFHLVKGSTMIARDVTGEECANDQAAQKLARGGNGLVALGMLSSDLLKQYHIQVLDEAGQIIVTVPFSALWVV